MSPDETGAVRGGVYTYSGLRRSEFLVVSIDALNQAGTVIVAEIADHAPEDVRGLLAVELGNDDPLPGRWVLCWRLNYANAARFDTAGGGHGTATERTMTAVDDAIRSAIEPL